MPPHAHSPLLCCALALTLTACGAGAAPDTDGLAGDPAAGDFVERAPGKADANGVEEHSFEAICALNLANSAPDELLTEDVFFSAQGVQNILAWRAGDDARWGTLDDRQFDNLGQLDDLPFVGRITFGHLLQQASKHGYCPELAQEARMGGEAEATEAIIARSTQFISQTYAQARPARRDAHAKAHGCVTATFEVDNLLLQPQERVGLFSQNRTFPAWIRFSNGGFHVDKDTTWDVRGMAIKLMDVPGEKYLPEEADAPTQDLLLINGATMFVRNPVDYVSFSQEAFDGNPTSYFLSLDPRQWHLRELFNLLTTVRKEPASPLRSRYWSTTPYLLGEGAIKYSARPCQGERAGAPDDAHDDYLSLAMSQELAEGDACFELLIQRQTDPRAMPIEDPTYEWSEELSPFLPVGRLLIPAQDFGEPARQRFCEDLSFTPWHTLPEHRPLGGVNRVRLKVYQAISGLRHTLNEAPRQEPSSHQLP
jgi:hypothetical protein